MKKQKKLISMFAIALAVALLLPGLSTAGSLEPPSNALDQSGNPVSTMKTLDQIPPAWSQKIPCTSTTDCPRFEIVMDGAAVLDKETGLVWERAPINYAGLWAGAQWECWTHSTGGRSGWRVPTVQEADSLADWTHNYYDCNSRFPCGHPFTLAPCHYWTSTTWWLSNQALLLMYDGGTGPASKDEDQCYWCVRGGPVVVDDHL